MIRRNLALVATGAAFALAAAGIASANGPSLIANGDFETGTLSSWTTFTTGNGTINGGNVQLFDTTGNGASKAAHFNVGDAVFTGLYEGGGIYQSFYGQPSGASADIAAHDTGGSGNASCGKFELLVDNVVIASHDFDTCPAGGTVRAHLLGVVRNAGLGFHEVRIRITRPYTTFPGSTPDEYVDNVAVSNKIHRV